MSHLPAPVVRSMDSVESQTVDRSRGAAIQVLIGPTDGAPNFVTRRFTLAPGGRIPSHRHDTIEHEQVMLSAEALGDAVRYLLPEMTVTMEWFEGEPIGVELPPTVELRVVETAPGIKDATAQAQRKPATMENGLVVQVPSFIEEGELIRVSTIDGSYAERAK